jgi:hypothetical protein
MYGSGSLCSPKWKSALLSFVAEESSSQTPYFELNFRSGIDYDFRFRNALFSFLARFIKD